MAASGDIVSAAKTLFLALKTGVTINVAEFCEGYDEEDDEDIWTTPEWLAMCAFTERTRREMEQNRHTGSRRSETDEEGKYAYRTSSRFDGADDDEGEREIRSVSRRKSMSSHNSLEEGKWSKAAILHLSDRIRRAHSCQRIPDKDLEKVHELFSHLLDNENNYAEHPERCITLEAIAYARLDKFLNTIFAERNEIVRPSPLFGDIYVDAIALQDRWHARFKKSYQRLDDFRLHHLKTCGAFHDVEVNRYSDSEETLFIVKRYKPTGTYIEMDNRFQPGDWWLNGACAYRDGITGGATDVVSECRYGVLTLILSSGMEDSEDNGRTSLYTITESFDCIPLELIKLNFGKPVRVLRGSGLSSEWAPKGGLRYDGLYTLKVFGAIHHGGDIWTWNLTLRQLDKEPDLDTVQHIPSPSQQDDWKLCNAMVQAILENAQPDLAKIEELRDRASTPEWEEQINQLSKRLSDATDMIRANGV